MGSKEQAKAYKNLATAIVYAAARDYVSALKRSDKGRERECERFFRSEWFLMLSDLNGEAIVKKLRSTKMMERVWCGYD